MNKTQLQLLVDTGDFSVIKQSIKDGNIFLVEGRLLLSEDHEAYQKHRAQESYYDMLQGVRKVLLNSAYGATLNEFCRFHDPRLGASTTGSGRQITTFMLETITEQLLGERILVKKTVNQVTSKTQHFGTSGDSISLGLGIENDYTIDTPFGCGPIMSDTDSCYFSMADLITSSTDVDTAVELADGIVKFVNDSFPGFMRTAFNCQEGFDGLIKANREVVASSGIIRAKKNYVFYAEDMEGKRITDDANPKRLKLQGGDLKISSTPERIRTFLREITFMILKGVDKKEIENHIVAFRSQMSGTFKPLEFATTANAKTLDDYELQWERIEKPGLGKVRIPGHIRAAINYNQAIEIFKTTSSKIVGGSKVKIIWLEKNDYEFKSIAFPSESEELPLWFTQNFKVDYKLTEQKMIDTKLGNTFDPIGWQVPTAHTIKVASLLSFD